MKLHWIQWRFSSWDVILLWRCAENIIIESTSIIHVVQCWWSDLKTTARILAGLGKNPASLHPDKNPSFQKRSEKFMNKKLQIPKHAQLLPGKKFLEGLRFVVSELATRKLWIVVFKASEWMSCTGLNHPGPSRTMSLSFTNPENEWIRPRTQPAFFRGYASFGGSRISMFVLPLSDVEAMTKRHSKQHEA